MWASVAAADMLLRQEGIDVALKWPNDLVARGRKLAGVLAETRSDQPLAVVGIGINVLSTSADRPQELRDRAVSLLELEYRGWDRSFMLANILNSLGVWWKVFCSQGWPAIYERWRELSSIIGREVRLQYLNKPIVGIAEDIDPMGHLVLRAPDGKQYVVSAAEITDLVFIQGVPQNEPENGR
jgi:BirA family biotin operon repressor/biotin-[acetyl-CoA-carboxylase] ligase